MSDIEDPELVTAKQPLVLKSRERPGSSARAWNRRRWPQRELQQHDRMRKISGRPGKVADKAYAATKESGLVVP